MGMGRRRKRVAAAASGLGLLLERNRETRIGRLACSVCDHYIMGSSAYVIMIGLIGTVITALDIARLMNRKVPVGGRTGAGQRPRTEENEIGVAREIERDLRLMTSILGIEHYTLVMLGAITEYPVLHTQWLLMQLCVFVVETAVFFVRVFFVDGMHVKRDEILASVLTVHNWLQVFCLFHRQARRSNR